VRTAFALLFLLSLPVSAEELRGKVELLAKGGRGPARGSDVKQATRKKEFTPRVLAVPKGSRVRFPNQDPILHNVFSVSGGNKFDLGLYRLGPGKEKRFEEPGLVRVYCNVHHDMAASILVLDTPFFASPGPTGEFVLAGLPRGKGKLTVWHEQAEPWTIDVDVPGVKPVAARIEVVKPLIPSHLNKSGQSYFRSQRDRYNH
jgi:plastocyanin